MLFGIKAREGQVMDIEFAGGTSVQFDLKQPMAKDALAAELQHSGHKELAAANPVPLDTPVNGKYGSFDLLTPSTNAVAVRDAVIETLQSNLEARVAQHVRRRRPGRNSRAAGRRARQAGPAGR